MTERQNQFSRARSLAEKLAVFEEIIAFVVTNFDIDYFDDWPSCLDTFLRLALAGPALLIIALLVVLSAKSSH